jgi:hypothetical protein
MGQRRGACDCCPRSGPASDRSLSLRREGQVEQTEPEASWGLAHSEKVPLAVSMPSAEDHRRQLRDYGDATAEFTVRDMGDNTAVENRERD